MKVAGLVLAGGRSSRFGSDKALAAFGGRRLIDWSLDALGGCAVVGLNGPAALAQTLHLPCIADLQDMAPGPLAGVLAGLDWAAASGCSHLFTAPCDTPFLPSDLLALLIAEIGERAVVVARAERVHALCALWRCDLGPVLREVATNTRQPSLQRLIEQVGGGLVDFADEPAFANLNTPQELKDAARRLNAVTQNKP